MATVLVHLKNTIVHAARDFVTGGDRSPAWPALERKFKAQYPRCAICGAVDRIQVHHKKPFHLYPTLELEPSNLVSLCMVITHECHLLIGHGHNFKAYNPRIESHVKQAGGLGRDLVRIQHEAQIVRIFT